MQKDPNLKDDELDLRELFAVLWSHKLLIALLTGFSIFLFAYKVLTTEKKFTANAIFQIQQNDRNSGFNLTGELGALASLAGLNNLNKGSSLKVLLERATGREFIVSMKEKLILERDPYFNTYNPDYKEPFWKASIKQIIGWKKTATAIEKKSVIEQIIISNYRSNVYFEETDGGSISISVIHADPEKASDYANNLMEETRRLVESESNSAQQIRLSYLSEILADALQEMEKAQQNLKNYALENSTMAQENFISDSLKLDKLRMEKLKVNEISDLLSILESLLKTGKINDASYETLRSSHPLVDDLDFRRILGMSETISAWDWPDLETITAVSITLRDRINRINTEINNIEENAKIYARSAEDFAKLTRQAKIAEATYKVLVEQVKSQSLVAGFQPETFKVFEYATPPLSPSSPRRNLTLALGAVLGIFIGCSLALLNAKLRSVYYSRSALLTNTDAKLSLKSKPFRRLAKKTITEIVAQIPKRQVTALHEANLKLANKKIIYVMNSGGQPTALHAARLLATQSAQSGRNVVLCDAAGQSEKEIKEKIIIQNSGSPIQKISDNLSLITGVKGSSFFTSKTFNSTIKDLAERFDQVFVCASSKDAKLGWLALLEFSPGLVMISGLRKTKRSVIDNIKTKQPVDLLFYD